MTRSITTLCHDAECHHYAECCIFYCYAERHYFECRSAERRNAECRYAKCCYAERRYAECHYAECLKYNARLKYSTTDRQSSF